MKFRGKRVATEEQQHWITVSLLETETSTMSDGSAAIVTFPSYHGQKRILHIWGDMKHNHKHELSLDPYPVSIRP
jgi:hypothetical protein